ncbi:hypothetical protein A4X06_0g3820 [Tilletia controversa]|uniref:Uncharacterized protein n=1 Tax=Tilletia controversa TaxID=13291 RepID=A0A8X7SX94_9BASI|nr:hypothetical protein CF328_g9514 [Tilletia controversa]KAE8248303.1 hypothetical protein A4X06_0g3820 [Tilletia controversa]
MLLLPAPAPGPVPFLNSSSTTSSGSSPLPSSSADALPAITTMVELMRAWTQGGSGLRPLSEFSTAGLSGAVQQKVSRWRRLASVVEEMALIETGAEGRRRRRGTEEVAETMDRAIKKRKVGLRKLVDMVAKEDTKASFLEELEWI